MHNSSVMTRPPAFHVWKFLIKNMISTKLIVSLASHIVRLLVSTFIYRNQQKISSYMVTNLWLLIRRDVNSPRLYLKTMYIRGCLHTFNLFQIFQLYFNINVQAPFHVTILDKLVTYYFVVYHFRTRHTGAGIIMATSHQITDSSPVLEEFRNGSTRKYIIQIQVIHMHCVSLMQGSINWG